MSGLLAHVSRLSEDHVRALAEGGVRTVGDLLCDTAEAVHTRVPSVPISALVDAQLRLVARCAPSATTADAAWANRQTQLYAVRTCVEIDTLLDGGLLTGEILELAGSSGSGKTWLCMCAAAHAALELSASVVYVDTGNNFVAAAFEFELHRISRALGLPPDAQAAALKRVRVVRAHEVDEIVSTLLHLHAVRTAPLVESDAWYRLLGLVIVDNPALALAPLLARDSSGQQWMVSLARALRKLARANVAVLVTNTLVSAELPLCPGLIHDKVKPALGASWRPVCDSRVILGSADVGGGREPHSAEVAGPIAIALIEKSSRQPVGKTVVLRRNA
jgi:hypothetical protein